jgi:hypothetical protein
MTLTPDLAVTTPRESNTPEYGPWGGSPRTFGRKKGARKKLALELQAGL